jgi:hypothetical protein
MKDEHLLKMLADTFDLDPKDKDFKKKIMVRLKDDKNIPDALKKTASNVIISTVSESVTPMQTFKEFRKRVDEASSSMDTLYNTPRRSATDFNDDNVNDLHQDKNKDGHIDGDVNRDGKVDGDVNKDGIPDYDLEDDTTTDDIYGNLIGTNDDVVDDIFNGIGELDDLIDLDVYDDEEFHIVDDEGNHVGYINPGIVDPYFQTNESVERIDEMLSRRARMKMAVKFHQSQSKRMAKMKIALHTKSSPAKIASRARKAAVLAFKMKMAKKPLSALSLPEKERLEKMVQKKRATITKLANKLLPKIKKIESTRLARR